MDAVRNQVNLGLEYYVQRDLPVTLVANFLPPLSTLVERENSTFSPSINRGHSFKEAVSHRMDISSSVTVVEKLTSKRAEALGLDVGLVDEDVFSAISRRDEAEALLDIEPLDSAL